MLLWFLKLFACLLAWLPTRLVAMLCRLIGLLVRIFMRARSRNTLNSLSHAFPERTEAWRRGVFRESCARLAEMGLFRLASAYFSPERLERTLELTPEAAEIVKDYQEGGRFYGRPVVIMLPHMTLSEAATMLPGRVPGLKPVHVIFRPLNQPSINRWVTQERERFGATMISRRTGHNDGMAALRRGEIVAVLFDQDAGSRGSVITFMNRIASATDLPALMAHRFGADVFLMLPERQSFWKAQLTLTPIPLGEAPVDITIRAHDALAAYLRRDTDTAADWLWLHERWKFAYKPHKRFRLPEKRNQIARSSALHGGRDSLPRKVRFWVRLPDARDQVVDVLPVLHAIRAARPDFEFTVIGDAAYEGLIDRSKLAEHFIGLPPRGLGYFTKFFAMREKYPDTYLILSESLCGDVEAFLTRCPQRFGVVRRGQRRLLLTDPFALVDADEGKSLHPTQMWEAMARFYGLRVPLSDY